MRPAIVQDYRDERGSGLGRGGDGRQPLYSASYALHPAAELSGEAGSGYESRLGHRDADPGGDLTLKLVGVVENRELGVGVGGACGFGRWADIRGGGLCELNRIAPGRIDAHSAGQHLLGFPIRVASAAWIVIRADPLQAAVPASSLLRESAAGFASSDQPPVPSAALRAAMMAPPSVMEANDDRNDVVKNRHLIHASVSSSNVMTMTAVISA